jgi:hypothetical protein
MYATLTTLLLIAPLQSNGVHYVLEGPGGETPAYGRSVADLADLNGDGVRDLAVGLPRAQGSRILLVSGRTGANLRTIGWPLHTFMIGNAVANVGDVDGDGFEDVGTVVFDSLGLVVVFSSATGALLWNVQVPRSVRPQLVGAGDVNGDGKGDVLYSDGQVGGFGGNGNVRLLSGADGSVLDVVTGGTSGQGLGALAVWLDDVDGDGLSDLALSDKPGLFASSRLFVLSGATGQRIRSLPIVFGSSATRVGDLDGDGRDDLLITGASRARAVSTATWLDLWTTQRPFILGHYPGTVPVSAASAGDVDGDGRDDVLLGYDDQTRIGHHLPGVTYQGPGQVEVISGADGSQLASFTGTAMNQGYGSSVGALGDIDGDGMLDVWVASPRWERDGEVVGAIEIRSALEVLTGPTSYCVAGGNAGLTWSGTTSVANNNLVFTVTGGIPNETAVLLYGQGTGARMFGGGTLCIADEVYRARGGRFDAQGGFVAPLDLNALPQAPIGVGSTWNFQVWYRTPGAIYFHLPRVNLSDALRVPFVP